ncbi:MAG: S9 family peptidase [Acidobacteriota bacterium]|nr:S9 family peptidase [Acidobacteriota bacterium]
MLKKHFKQVCSILLVLFLLVCSNLTGKKEDSSKLTLGRIFSSDEFSQEKFGPARWLKDGSGYTTLEDSKTLPKGKDIIKYDSASSKREVLVAAERLVPKGKESPLKIEDYTWSLHGNLLLIFTDTKRVWRRNTRGDYWILDLNTWKLQKLCGKAEPSTLMFAKFSPDSTRVGYVIKNNIYVEDIKENSITKLTHDGSDTVINGTFDWVYEEEFSLRDGFRWSPDGKYIAYWQLDTEGVRDFYLINNTDSLYPKIIPVQYPKAGETNSAIRLGVVSSKGGKTRWFKLPGDSRDFYLARMDWAANSEEIVFQRLNRLQNTIWLMLGNIQSGKVKTILTENEKTWAEVVDDLKWFDNGANFTWLSERDGWRHVYLISRSGQKVRCITSGDYDILSIRCIDDKGGWLYFTASPENPTQRYLFRVPLSGSERPERLTPSGSSGTHSYQISENAGRAIHTFSSFGNPPVTELVSLPDHKTIRLLAENTKLRKKVKNLDRCPVEFFRVDIGNGVNLDAWCMKPPDFDPAKKYPLLFFVYGEPAGQTVLDRWGGNRYLWHLMLAQKGYLIMSVDNRGTPAPRGRAWRKSIYRQIGILASKDQAAAARAIIKQRTYVDAGRIGVWGWSGGGSMSLNLIFRYPDLYKTAMAIAFVSNQRFYDTIYQERYMGLPDDNKEGFKNGSPITHAHKLEGNLLIVHGTGDDNVHYQSCEALVNELIEHNKHFTMMAYPNRSHGIYEGKNTTIHLYTLLTRYLKENLTPGPREMGQK